MDKIPRRATIDGMSEAELAIYVAIKAIEDMAADTRLTEAVILLQKARNKVADYIDEVD